MNLPSYIAIEGSIGVGKTSLARRLADSFQTDLLLEGADENPFLEQFYDDPRHALPAQLFFLYQRAQQMEGLQQRDMFAPVIVADFMMQKDPLFAELTLNKDELALYQKVYNSLTIDIKRPDLVVYLQAPVEVLQQRIAGRGIDYEQSMGSHYLQQLNDAYARFFLHYDETPLLIVNASLIDWVNNDADYELLLQEILATRHGRRFFNPGMT